MSRARIVVALVAIAALSLTTRLVAQAADRADIAKTLEANERAIYDAMGKGDIASFRKLVPDDSIVVNGAGVFSAAAFAKGMAQLKFESWTIDNYRVTWINDATAIGSYRWNGKASIAGQPLPSSSWESTLWVNRGGNWVAMFSQTTPAMPDPTKK